MSGFGILMIIFATCLLLVGLYMFTGHKLGIFDYRPAFKNIDKAGWRKVGIGTIIVSIFIYIAFITHIMSINIIIYIITITIYIIITLLPSIYNASK